MARTGRVIGRRRAVVIRHRKRINKCQVARRERGWVARHVIHVVAGCYKSSFGPPIAWNFSLISSFCDFSFLPSRLWSRCREYSYGSRLFPQHSTHFTKSTRTVALRITSRDAFNLHFTFFFLEARYSVYICDDCRRPAVLSFACEQFRLRSNLRHWENTIFLSYSIIMCCCKSTILSHDEIFYSIISLTWSIIKH